MLSRLVAYTAHSAQTKLRYLIPLIFIVNIVVCVGLASLMVLRNQSLTREALQTTAVRRWPSPTASALKFTAGENGKQQAEHNTKELTAYLARAGISGNYSIYFEDLRSGVTITHRESQLRHPASIYKMSLGLLIMHDFEAGKIDLQKTVKVKDKTYTLEKIMELMYVESNNDAMSIFERELGGYQETQKRIREDFDARVERIGQRTTAADLAKLFKKLYFSTDSGYLSEEGKQKILNYMFAELSWLQDRIPAGVRSLQAAGEVSSEVKVASKIGTLDGVYQDGALIFGANSDYTLVILNQNRLTTEAVPEIKQIVKVVLEGFE
jgi:beta-lactamase class A